jgi:hypothetical protein
VAADFPRFWPVLKKYFGGKTQYDWLQPPASLGKLTVADVQATSGADEQLSMVRSWALQMGAVWSPYHVVIRAWADGA